MLHGWSILQVDCVSLRRPVPRVWGNLDWATEVCRCERVTREVLLVLFTSREAAVIIAWGALTFGRNTQYLYLSVSICIYVYLSVFICICFDRFCLRRDGTLTPEQESREWVANVIPPCVPDHDLLPESTCTYSCEKHYWGTFDFCTWLEIIWNNSASQIHPSQHIPTQASTCLAPSWPVDGWKSLGGSLRPLEMKCRDGKSDPMWTAHITKPLRT